MNKEAKVFLITGLEWETLSSLLEASNEFVAVEDLCFIKLTNYDMTTLQIAILSISRIADEIIKQYGAKLTSENDIIKYSLKNYRHELLYGNLELSAMINWRM